jgi:metal-sulfur cluster biosynthetic enzyme
MERNAAVQPTESGLREAMREVMDPEAGMNIVDLGLVYGVRIGAGRVEVDLTMTTPACPMGAMIVDEARAVLRRALPATTEVVVNLVWEPPWSPSMMSGHARKHFGWK